MGTKPPPHERDNDNGSISSSTGEDDDQTWDDWASDSLKDQEYRSLFDDVRLPSVEKVVSYDKEKHGFDLYHVCSKLGSWTIPFLFNSF